MTTMIKGTPKKGKAPKKTFKPQPAPKAAIAISYRLEGTHLGKAAFYDHYTLASHTGFPTTIIHADNPSISTNQLKSYISTQTVNIPHTPIDATLARPVPLKLNAYTDGGLLFVPGMTRESYEKAPAIHRARIRFEKSVIKDALRRGRPILAVCAGSWTLWETLGGSIEEVTDHNYGGGMPRISETGKMTYNKHVHDVEISENTLLHTMLDLDDTEDENILPVNSIHWMAPSAQKIPENFEISATAKQNEDVSIQTRQQTEMSPEEDTVEAFTSKFGAPTAGILWHLEAFDWSSKKDADIANNNALLFMAKAGSAYQAKQKMLIDYKSKIQAVEDDTLEGLNNVFGKLKIS